MSLTIKCPVCCGSGKILDIMNYYDACFNCEEPIYEEQPCEVCGGYGEYKEGEPCAHRGCMNHITHHCEVCGRIAGKIVPGSEDLQAKYDELVNAIHNAMGRLSDCDKKQTHKQLVSDISYLKRLASDHARKRQQEEEKYRSLLEKAGCLCECLRTHHFIWEGTYPEIFRKVLFFGTKKEEVLAALHALEDEL